MTNKVSKLRRLPKPNYSSGRRRGFLKAFYSDAANLLSQPLHLCRHDRRWSLGHFHAPNVSHWLPLYIRQNIAKPIHNPHPNNSPNPK